MFRSDTATALDPTPEQLTEFAKQRLQHEDQYTDTWVEQHQVEERIFLIRAANKPQKPLLLFREKHVLWLVRCLQGLPRGFQAFDALQGWMAFWIVHSLDLLGGAIPPELTSQLIEYLDTFRDEQGGFGGGPGQTSHLAATFSVFMALCAIGTEEALSKVDKESIGRFVLSMKQDDGSFRVSVDGETDVRAMYCAVAMLSMLGMLDGEEGTKYKRGCAEYIASLQAFDGGLGGEPGSEAHGGNSYCGLATLVILGERDAIDLERLLDWAVMRQMRYEGGFQGRCNKLVDSCYSFWVGSLFPLLATLMGSRVTASLFNATMLQRYVLECCQLEHGGLRDKPGMSRDLMHTCYALSGLSITQHYGGGECVEGNELRRTNPVYNLCTDKFERAWDFFRR